MNKLHRRFGVSLLCTVVVMGCNGTAESSKEDTSSAKTATPPTATSARFDGETLPSPQVSVTKDYGDEHPAYKLMITMRLPASGISMDKLEKAVSNGQGAAVLDVLLAKFSKGTDASWSTLKAALRCDPADFPHHDSRCGTVKEGGIRASGKFPIPDLLLTGSYAAANMSTGEKILQVPDSAFEIEMEIPLKGGGTTHANVQRELASQARSKLLEELVKDKDINPGVHFAAWATLKAALGCTDFQPTEKQC